MIPRALIRDEALVVAQAQVGVREAKNRPNSGPEVDKYLAECGLPPGHAWCAALVVFCYAEAARRLGGIHLMPLRRTAKVARLWYTSPMLWRSGTPTRGAIFCRLENPQVLDGPGHCGLVLRVDSRGEIETIEGNTNQLGSRVGDRVRINRRKPGYINLGYLDVGRVGPEAASVLVS